MKTHENRPKYVGVLFGVLSLICPGLGQFQLGKSKIAFSYLTVIFVLQWIFFRSLRYGRGYLYTVSVIVLLVWLSCGIHAYWSARNTESRPAGRIKKSVFYFIATTILFSSLKGLSHTRFFMLGGNSMAPTYVIGDRVVVDTEAYDVSKPAVGDVIVYHVPHGRAVFVSRIVGLPGDKIEITNDKLFVNGTQIKATPAKLASAFSKAIARFFETVPREFRPGYRIFDEQLGGSTHYIMHYASIGASNYGPKTVPSNRLFVMGDNRDNSFDSRYSGFLPMRDVIGKVLYRYYPLK